MVSHPVSGFCSLLRFLPLLKGKSDIDPPPPLTHVLFVVTSIHVDYGAFPQTALEYLALLSLQLKWNLTEYCGFTKAHKQH